MGGEHHIAQACLLCHFVNVKSERLLNASHGKLIYVINLDSLITH